MAPRIVLATRPVSFNKEQDGLAAVVEHELGLDPYSGVAVVFRCRAQCEQIKVLWWDGSSLVLAHKRLEHGRCDVRRSTSIGRRFTGTRRLSWS